MNKTAANTLCCNHIAITTRKIINFYTTIDTDLGSSCSNFLKGLAGFNNLIKNCVCSIVFTTLSILFSYICKINLYDI